MRRLSGVIAVGVLAVALTTGVSRAAAPSLGVQLAQRVFSEVAAPATESFMREDVFVVDISKVTLPTVDYAAVRLPILASRVYVAPPAAVAVVNANVSTPAYVASASSVSSSSLIESPAPIPVVGTYQERAPLALVSQSSVSPLLSFSGTLAPQGGAVNVPGRIGRVQFSTHAAAFDAQAADASVADRAVAAGATLNVRAGRRDLGVDLSSSFEQVNLNATPTLGAADDIPAFIPSYADVSKRTVSAGLTVPLSRRLTGSFQVDSQHLLGGFGAPGLENLDANNTVLGARVTFQLPKSASAITLSAKQLHYQDNLVPTNTFVQTSANVDFTIKF